MMNVSINIKSSHSSDNNSSNKSNNNNNNNNNVGRMTNKLLLLQRLRSTSSSKKLFNYQRFDDSYIDDYYNDDDDDRNDNNNKYEFGNYTNIEQEQTYESFQQQLQVSQQQPPPCSTTTTIILPSSKKIVGKDEVRSTASTEDSIISPLEEVVSTSCVSVISNDSENINNSKESRIRLTRRRIPFLFQKDDQEQKQPRIGRIIVLPLLCRPGPILCNTDPKFVIVDDSSIIANDRTAQQAQQIQQTVSMSEMMKIVSTNETIEIVSTTESLMIENNTKLANLSTLNTRDKCDIVHTCVLPVVDNKEQQSHDACNIILKQQQQQKQNNNRHFRQQPLLWKYSSNHVMINQEREKHCIHPLIRLHELDTVAKLLVNDMAQSELLQYIPNETLLSCIQSILCTTTTTNNNNNNTKLTIVQQNICKGTTICDIHTAMISNHQLDEYKNIINPNFYYMGMATTTTSSSSTIVKKPRQHQDQQLQLQQNQQQEDQSFSTTLYLCQLFVG